MPADRYPMRPAVSARTHMSQKKAPPRWPALYGKSRTPAEFLGSVLPYRATTPEVFSGVFSSERTELGSVPQTLTSNPDLKPWAARGPRDRRIAPAPRGRFGRGQNPALANRPQRCVVWGQNGRCDPIRGKVHVQYLWHHLWQRAAKNGSPRSIRRFTGPWCPQASVEPPLT